MFGGLNEIEDDVSGMFLQWNKMTDRGDVVFWFSADLLDSMGSSIVWST